MMAAFHQMQLHLSLWSLKSSRRVFAISLYEFKYYCIEHKSRILNILESYYTAIKCP